MDDKKSINISKNAQSQNDEQPLNIPLIDKTIAPADTVLIPSVAASGIRPESFYHCGYGQWQQCITTHYFKIR